MKNILCTLLTCCAFALFTPTSHAQTAAEEAAVKSFWNETWATFDAGNVEGMWAAYTDDAAEIGPDGTLTTGKKALRESWDMFMKMADAPPTFKYENPSVRILTPDIALVTWDSEADIKIGGQQLGGKSKGMAVLHKIKGSWKIELDTLTPIMEMPSGN